MNPRRTIVILLLIVLLITQLPTIFCVLDQSPGGDIEDTNTTETANNIEDLVGCITPTSAFGLFFFIVGGFAAALLNE